MSRTKAKFPNFYNQINQIQQNIPEAEESSLLFLDEARTTKERYGEGEETLRLRNLNSNSPIFPEIDDDFTDDEKIGFRIVTSFT